jgi:hypothetical protein
VTVKQDEQGVKFGERPMDFAGPLPERYVEQNPDYRGYLKNS